MVESKSGNYPKVFKGHSEKSVKFEPIRINRLANHSECRPLRSPFSSLLPKDFSEPTTASASSDGSSGAVPYCMMSAFDSTTIRFVPGRVGNPHTGTPGYPAEITTRNTRVIEHINYLVTQYISFGGRPIYNVDLPLQPTWKSDTFTKVVLHRADYADIVQSIEPGSKTTGCLEMPNVQQGSPDAFASFMASLGDYCVLAAMEGRFLALQQSALLDLDNAKKLDATLKHG